MTITSRAVLAVFLSAAFLLLASVGGQSNGLDAAVAAWFDRLRTDTPAAIGAAGAFTVIGGAPVTLGLALMATIWLLVKRMPRRALLLAATVLFVRLTTEVLKDAFGRPRPEADHLPASLAFPSGHAANSMTTYLALALIAIPGRYRRPAVLAALAITFAVGATRLVLGVHWASDIFGGWTLGLLAVGVAVTIDERSAALRLETQHDVVAGHGSPVGEDEAA